MSSAPDHSIVNKRNAGRSNTWPLPRAASEREIHEAAPGQAATSGPAASTFNPPAFPEPSAHAPSFPVPHHEPSSMHTEQGQAPPPPSFPTPYGAPSFPTPDHNGAVRPLFMDVGNDADDEESDISTVPPLPNPFDRSLPSLPDNASDRSAASRRRTTAPIPSSSHAQPPPRSATLLTLGQRPPGAQAPRIPYASSALASGAAQSRDAVSTIPSMPSPTSSFSRPHTRPPPGMPSHTDYIPSPIPEEPPYLSPTSSHSYARTPAPYRSDTVSPSIQMPSANSQIPSVLGSSGPMHPPPPPLPEKFESTSASDNIARPQDVHPIRAQSASVSASYPRMNAAEHRYQPSALSRPSVQSDAPTIPTIPTVGSTIGSLSDDDRMSWASGAEKPSQASMNPKPSIMTSPPPKASASLALSSLSPTLAAPAAPTPTITPSKLNAQAHGDTTSSRYSTTQPLRPRPHATASRPSPDTIPSQETAAPKPSAPASSTTTAARPSAMHKPPSSTTTAVQAHDPEPSASRPPINPVSGGTQIGTQYTHMLLALDAVPFLHNAAANAATWMLLAGFVVLPGTFSTLSTLTPQSGTIQASVVHAVQNIPLFVIAFVLSGIGASGMCWLWWRWSRNYVWLLGHIFVPGALNGLAGVFSTLATVLGTQHGVFAPSAITTLAVTGATAVICGILAGWYTFFMLGRVKREHEREVGKEGAGKRGEGYIKAAKELMGVKPRR